MIGSNGGNLETESRAAAAVVGPMATTTGGVRARRRPPSSPPRNRWRAPTRRHRRRSRIDREQHGSVPDAHRDIVSGLPQAVDERRRRGRPGRRARERARDNARSARRPGRRRVCTAGVTSTLGRRAWRASVPSPCRPRPANPWRRRRPRRPPAPHRHRRDDEPVVRPESRQFASEALRHRRPDRAIAMSGACTTMAPRASSISPSSPGRSRVTSTRLPASGPTALSRAGSAAVRALRRHREVVRGAVEFQRSLTARPVRAGSARNVCSSPSVACAPTGNEHPEPSSARNARSTSTA